MHYLYQCPIEPAIGIIRKHLEDDKDLQQRTSMMVNHIICLLEFCLKNTYFIFQGRYYRQVEGAAMGSPISPIVANLYMEAFEMQALNTAQHPPSLWRRLVDDTFVVIQAAHKGTFIEHINSINDRIQFTMEESKSNGSMPFLDTLVIPQPDGSFSTMVYRKPTHIDLYLQLDSHHTTAAKYSVVNTLHNRAKAVCSNSQLLEKGRRPPSESPTRKQVPHVGFEIGWKWSSKHPQDKTRTSELTSVPMLQLAIQDHIW